MEFGPELAESQVVSWQRVLPLVLLHVACLFVFVVGVSWAAVTVCALAYFVRMFAITAFYHRYFSHRSFKTSRLVQFAGAFAGNSSLQRGPLWWAAHHRKHHKFADTERDNHSPSERGFWWSHILWFTTPKYYRTDLRQVRDLARYPELVFLDRFDLLAPLTLAVLSYLLGAFAPASWNTSGPQMLVWGFLVSTIVLFHGTFTINSFGHLFGRRRYDTPDQSKNNVFLALITLGEGWHNNHHHYPVSTRQGFFWWEIDLTYYVLRAMSLVGLVRDLRPVPVHVREGNRQPVRVEHRRSA
ncbi:MAG: acyl-CoA desaturase [Planctomycetota bacterium]